ncbi:hypothetical protein ILP92_11165 [Maribius pontilimi]|uniref:Uncharacterized protein n=1 Tax=Palleronia pontilimi TaxID=1964209 RepID=A0A934MA71_9RHOB|nr:hypothetical protein [Palleronia pontilimi]MBJ3763307.1 hypothetical protein [Palleronia pontilimi]
MTRSSAETRSEMGHGVFQGMAKKKTKDRKQDKQSPVQVGEHHRYQIKSGNLAGTFVARAFPKPPTQARGLIAEASGATEEAAIIALHEVLDSREQRRAEDRRTDEHTGASVPSVEEYVEAIGHVALTRPQRAMLLALALSGATGLTETQMASAAGYKSQASGARSFTSAGLLIAEYLSSEAGSTDPSGDPDARSIMGFRAEPEGAGDPDLWIAHPELREAIQAVL